MNVRKELEATRTIENIENVLTDSKLMSHDQRHCLVVVSSTFHLPRIGRELDHLVHKNRHDIQTFVSDICLVGVEEPHDAKVAYPTTEWSSIKSMMFELYQSHLF